MIEQVEVLNIDLTKAEEQIVQTGKTLKDLRKELKDLKTDLENTAVDSADYASKLNAVNEAQRNLTAITKGASVGVSDYRTQIRNLKQELSQLTPGTDEYNNKLKELANTTRDFRDQQLMVNNSAADFGQKVGNAATFMAGFTGTLQAANGALQLMGIESDDVTAAIQKMQSAMAITQGLSAIDNGIKAYNRMNAAVKANTVVMNIFKKSTTASTVATEGQTVAQTKLNVAMNANPLGVIIAALTVFIATVYGAVKAIQRFISVSDENNKKSQELLETNQALLAADEKESHEIEHKAKLLAAEGKSTKEVSEFKKKETQAILNNITAKRQETQAQIDSMKAHSAWYRFWHGENKAIKELEESLKALQEEEKKYTEKTKEYEEQIEIEVVKAAHNSTAAVKKSAKEIKDTQAEAAKALYEKTLEDSKTEIQALEDKYKKERELLIKYGFDTTKLTSQYEKKRQDILKKGLDDKVSAYNQRASNIGSGSALQAEFMRVDFEWRYRGKDVPLETIQENIKKIFKVEDDAIIAQMNLYQTMADNEKLTTEQRAAAAAKVQELIINLDKLEIEQDAALQEAFESDINKKVESLQGSISILTDVANAMGSPFAQVFTAMSAGLDQVATQLKEGKKDWTLYASGAASALGVAASFMNALASQQDETTQEGFEQQKKFQIAATLMSMAQGIMSAWVSAMSPTNAWLTGPGQIALGAAMSAMIAAMGAMQIAEIKKQQFNGGSSGTPNTSAALNAIQQPQTVAQVTGVSQEEELRDTRVYVLESDIKRVSNRVNVTESEARY